MRLFHHPPLTTHHSPLFLVLGLLLGTTAQGAVAPSPAGLSEARMRRDITYLASPVCEGRGPLTKGIDLAADYIAAEFKKAGLQPGNAGSYFQPFSRPANLLEATPKLVLRTPENRTVELKPGVDFQPMGLSEGGKAEAPLVFAGYGITTDPKADLRYDDYDGLDVSGKVVIVLRDAPRAKAPKPPSALRNGNAMSLSAKLARATKNGAKAVLFVTDAGTASSGDDLLDFNFTALSPGGAKIPAFHLKRALLDRMLHSVSGKGLEDMEKTIDNDLKPHSLPLTGWTADLELKTRRDQAPLKNVVGVLEGAGPLAKETVVIGAHYDHLGYGGVSSRTGGRKMALHPGADDNGSGTTTVLELARRFASIPNRQGRRLVFITFSGEELGLFGSQHYCNSPLFPLTRNWWSDSGPTTTMLNLDMVGRLSIDPKTGKAKLLSEGNGTAAEFKDLVDKLMTKYDFQLKAQASGFGPSDHASFCGKKIPVLFFWTGYHDDYHMPGDTADKINVPGMRKVADMAVEVATWMATVQKRPAFVEVKRDPGVRPAGGAPRLGIRPAYGDDDDKGVEVEGVSDDLPAARAGIKGGDRIVGIEGKPVKNLQTYMQAMGGVKAGSTIEVAIERGGKKMTVKVKLD
jgi:hypothetical protein